jgi:hypothetical protein
MSKKTRKLTNKAGKLMKCDGQMLKKVIEAKGYKLYELSRMLRYCSDYLTSCCRQNQISDVAAKYLMDYKIFPQMYDLEGEIKVDEPKEVKIDKDDNLKKIAEKTIDRDSIYGTKRPEYAPDDVIWAIPKEGPDHVFGPTAQEVKKVLNEKYGRLEKDAKGIDYGYGPAPKNPSYYAAGHDIAKGVFKLMQASIDDLKRDPEFKELIKQAVKEAYEEL